MVEIGLNHKSNVNETYRIDNRYIEYAWEIMMNVLKSRHMRKEVYIHRHRIYYRSRENEKAEGWSVGTIVITRRMSQTDTWCCQVAWDIFIWMYNFSMASRILL